jgi:tRNA (cytosine40_48-C5)-methyltransferase
MDYLPQELVSRIKDIYTPGEQTLLQQAFEIKKRPTTFRVNTLKTTDEKVKAELIKKGISFQKIDLLPYGYILESTDEKVLWELDIYKKGEIYIQ